MGHSTAGTGLLTHKLSASTPNSVIATLGGKDALSSLGLGHYTGLPQLGVFPARVFQPSKKDMYRQIYNPDARDGHETGILWTAAYDLDVSFYATHEVASTPSTDDMNSLRQKPAQQVDLYSMRWRSSKSAETSFTRVSEMGNARTIFSSSLREEAAPHVSSRIRQYSDESRQPRANAPAKDLVRSSVQHNSLAIRSWPLSPPAVGAGIAAVIAAIVVAPCKRPPLTEKPAAALGAVRNSLDGVRRSLA